MPNVAAGRTADKKVTGDLLSPSAVFEQYGIPETTQSVWRCVNRYGFRDLAIKVGTRVKYRRGDLETWLESRRSSALAQA